MTGTSDDPTAPLIGDHARPALGPMFSAFSAAKRTKMPRWAIPLLTAAAVFHGVVFVTMWIRTIWDVEQLEKAKHASDLAIAPAPPPPPPPPAGGVKPQVQPLVPIKRKVTDLVQPVRIDQPTAQVSAIPSVTDVECDPTTEACSDGPGEKGGVVGQPPLPPPPLPPPPPPPEQPKLVAPMVLEGSRIAGDKHIMPDDITRSEIRTAQVDKLIGSFKLCLSTDGTVSAVVMMRSTGFSAYDARIQREMRTWRYRPYTVNGKVIPVCTAVTFIYSQR